MPDSTATSTQIHFVRLSILVPGVLGRVQFSSNSADVTALFWQASCDSRPATAMPGQDSGGRVFADLVRGSGDEGSPVSQEVGVQGFERRGVAATLCRDEE